MFIFLAKNYRHLFPQDGFKNMEKQGLNKDVCTALYFPFTYIQEELLKTILFFFDSLVLYQPSEWQPLPLYPELVRANLLRLEVPIPAGPDLPALRQKVRQFLSWGEYVFSSGQLGYLKHLEQSETALEGYGEIIAALRGEESIQPAFDDIPAIQLFLHLAQERDQRDHEMSRLRQKLDTQESKLWSELLLDAESLPQPSPTYIPEGEEVISIATRLKAWSRLFEKGFPGAEIPLTDKPAAIELLPPKELILEIPLPDRSGHTFPQVLEIRENNRALDAVATIKTHINQVIEQLSHAPLKTEDVKNMDSARLKNALQILEEEGSRLGNLPPYRLSLYVFPGISTSAMFSKGISNQKNGFAFLLTKGSIHEI